LIVIIV